MEAMGHVQSKWRPNVNFARKPFMSLRKIKFISYLHFVFTSFLCISCEILI